MKIIYFVKKRANFTYICELCASGGQCGVENVKPIEYLRMK